VIRAIVFDLDKCLAPPEEIGRAFFEPPIEAIRRANNGTLTDEALESAIRDFWHLSYDDIAVRHGFSPAMFEAGWKAYRALRMPGPLRGYGDLDVLPELDVPLILVTTGFRDFQESKIDALGIRDRFVDVIVDDIDGHVRLGKFQIFGELLDRHRWQPESVLVVGDNPESEIAAGNRLEMPTVQMLRPHVVRDPTARWHVRDLAELRDVLRDGTGSVKG
jgi:FMN phosphatase YigB (HAD superfamily)